MKKLLILIFTVFLWSNSFGQERIMEWSIGEPVVTCGATTTICYPLQVRILDDTNTPSLSTSTMRFFYDANYLENLNPTNFQNGYTITPPNETNSVYGQVFNFSTNTEGRRAQFDIIHNSANLLNLTTTPTVVMDLCFDVTANGVSAGEADSALCSPIVFSNDHTKGTGAINDEGYLTNSNGLEGNYFLNGDNTEAFEADDEMVYFGWTPNQSYDGVLDSFDDDIGFTNNTNCIPYLCAVEYIQIIPGPWDIATNWSDGVVPTINDDAIIDAGVASYLRQDQAVNNLELRPGSTVSIPNSGITGDPYILTVDGNIINDGDFTLYNANQNATPGAPTGTNGNPNVDGEVLLNNTTTPQTLSGTGNYYNLRVDNSNGVDVLNTNLTDPTEINGILTVDNGNFSTNDNVLIPCFFEDLGTNDFANGRAGQIGPIGIGGSISGDVRVEQCYPGRRAYRYVTSSVTTTNSIQDNWQENQGAYNQFPANATQVDVSPIINGIPYGFGTHITGLGYLPGHSPTGPGAIDQTDGLDWQPSGNPSMFEFDEATQSFNPVLATESTPLTVGKAYSMIIRGSREVDLTTNASPTYNTKLRSTGTVEQGNFTINTTVNAVPTPTVRQYVFVGNPFHAIVDMIAVRGNSTGLNQFVYAFDPTLGSNQDDTNDTSVLEGNRGAFVTIDLTEPPTSGMSNFLQAYQGVFMDAAVLNPSIVFNESDKAVREQQLDVFSTPTDRVTITLYDQNSYAANNTAADKVIIKFGQTKNSGIDFSDALKFFNPNENLGRLEGSSLLAIENRGMPQTGEVLDLFTTNYRTTDYVFVVKVDGLLDNTVSLYDNYTGTETVLNNDASTAVSFSVDPANPVSEATDRFELRFATSTLGTTDFDLQGISVYPNPASDILNINLGDNTGRFESLELFDINGRLVANKNLSNNVLDVQMDVNSFSSGVYILKVSSGAEQFSTKVIIE